jgi:hypothetical protein
MKSWIVIVGATCALWGGAPRAADGQPLPTPAYRTVDRATGARISLSRPGKDQAVIEVTTGRLSILKRLSPGRAETRIVSPAEDLTMTLDESGVVVRDARLGLVAGGTDQIGLTQARTRLQASAAVREALKLLDALEPVSGSPISQTLLVTQAMFESALDRPDAGADLELWARRPQRRRQLRTVAWQDGQEAQQAAEGPTDCWNDYAFEAIAAWIEYEQCVDAEEWWDAPGLLGCLLIYEMRAIGAFSWWVSCVGFRG